jgi:hypothetical protein
VQFDTKIAVVVRDDLPTWQKLNMTAFLISGIAGTQELVGDPYEDASGNRYLPMCRQPILVFASDAERLRTVYERAMSRGLHFSVFTEELFATGNDIDNRAAVKAVPREELRLVGLGLHGDKKVMDKVLKGLPLHGN